MLIIYPFIPGLVPLYLMPKYYGLHLMYLFMMITNLRLLADLADDYFPRQHKDKFRYIYFVNTLFLIIYTFLFSYIERGQFPYSFNTNWRSFFFFLSSFSIILLAWSWFFGIRALIKSEQIKQLVQQLKYPLIILPPIMLNIHKVQTPNILIIMLLLFMHGVLKEALKHDGPRPKHIAIFTYNSIAIYGAYFIISSVELCLMLFIIGIISIFIQKKFNELVSYVPILVYGWSSLFLNIY